MSADFIEISVQCDENGIKPSDLEKDDDPFNSQDNSMSSDTVKFSQQNGLDKLNADASQKQSDAISGTQNEKAKILEEKEKDDDNENKSDNGGKNDDFSDDPSRIEDSNQTDNLVDHNKNNDDSNNGQDNEDSNDSGGKKDSSEDGQDKDKPVENTEVSPDEDKQDNLENDNSNDSSSSKIVNSNEVSSTTINGEKDGNTKNKDDDDEIIEIPLVKTPVPVVDLIDDNDQTNQSSKKSTPNGKVKGIKVKSLDLITNNDNGCGTNNDIRSTNNVAIGDIVEHGEYVDADESGQMHLKISNVVGGEDSITGIHIDDDDDSISNLQIVSISSLNESESAILDVTMEEVAETDGQANNKDDQSESSNNSLRSIRKAVMPLDKSSSSDLNSDECKTTVHVLPNNLVVARYCTHCLKSVKCDYRVTMIQKMIGPKAGVPRLTRAFLCSPTCRSLYESNLGPESVVEKPRIFFERLCSMCSKDLGSIPKNKCYSWETREFCNKYCLADHISEVANKCSYCGSGVNVVNMGKYCVRFGSDILQFCTNMCLERHKVTINVCAFCQKSLLQVEKVFSHGSKKYCSDKCLKRSQRVDINQQDYKQKVNCTVCIKKNVNKYEFLLNGKTFLLCSDPCLNTFKYTKKVKAVICCVCTRVMDAEDIRNFIFNNSSQLRLFCTDSCLNVYILSIRKIVFCYHCKVKKYNFDMIGNTQQGSNSEINFCSVCCLNIFETNIKKTKGIANIPALPAVTTTTESNKNKEVVQQKETTTTTAQTTSNSSKSSIIKCNLCENFAPALFHMVMSDNTLRNFCSYTCATKFKSSFGYQVSVGNYQPPKTSSATIETETSVQTTVETPQSASITTTTLPNNETLVTTPPAVNSLPTIDLKRILSRLKMPPMINKSTMCQSGDSGASETNVDPKNKTIIPVPVPIYVPSPMMMYNHPCPVPIVIPVPVPVPVFIPTTEKTSEDLMEYLKVLNELHAREEYLKDMEELEKLRTQAASSDGISDDSDENGATVIDVEKLGSIEDKLLYSASNEDAKSSGKRRLSIEEEEDGPSKRSKSDANYDNATEAVKSGMMAWKHWVRKKTKDSIIDSQDDISEDLNAMSIGQLNYVLPMFLNEIRKPNGDKYRTDTIYHFLLGIQDYIFKKHPTRNIFFSSEFDVFKDSLNIILGRFIQQLYAVNLSNTTAQIVSQLSEEMLWQSKQLGAHNPHVLLNTLFYFNTKIFKFKSVRDHSAISIVQIVKQWRRMSVSKDGSVVRASLLKFFPKKDDTSDEDNKLYEMHENKTNPLRCPVKLYEFYLSKCPEALRSQRSMYYVFPEMDCQPNASVWFSLKPLDEGTITKMLNRTLIIKDIQQSLTNNS